DIPRSSFCHYVQECMARRAGQQRWSIR
ncbi:hypothetical protein A2U01_0064594, partial [Trifolium medium]|nr:hypothetical protein [Trifolium medium]